ncbi:hypothetical protein CYMTET_29765, partial [Cymbomonas tetramitiformis]
TSALQVVESTAHYELCCSPGGHLPKGAGDALEALCSGIEHVLQKRLGTFNTRIFVHFVNHVPKLEAEGLSRGEKTFLDPLWVYGLQGTKECPHPSPTVLATTLQSAQLGVTALALGGGRMYTVGVVFPLFALGVMRLALLAAAHEERRLKAGDDLEASLPSLSALLPHAEVAGTKGASGGTGGCHVLSPAAQAVCNDVLMHPERLAGFVGMRRPQVDLEVVGAVGASLVAFLVEQQGGPNKLRMLCLQKLTKPSAAGGKNDSNYLFYTSELSDSCHGVFGDSFEELWSSWQRFLNASKSPSKTKPNGSSSPPEAAAKSPDPLLLSPSNSSNALEPPSRSPGWQSWLGCSNGIQLGRQNLACFKIKKYDAAGVLARLEEVSQSRNLSPMETYRWSLAWWIKNDLVSFVKVCVDVLLLGVWKVGETLIIQYIFEECISMQESGDVDLQALLIPIGVLILGNVLASNGEEMVDDLCPSNSGFIPPMKVKVVSKISTTTQQQIDALSIQKVISTLEKDLEVLNNNLDSIVLSISIVIQLSGAIIAMVIMLWPFVYPAIAILLTVPLIGLYDTIMSPRLVRAADALLEHNKDTMMQIEESLTYVSCKRLLHLHSYFDTRLLEKAEQYVKSYDHLDATSLRHMVTMSYFSITIRMSVMLFGSIMVALDSLDVATYIAFTSAVTGVLALLVGSGGLAGIKRQFDISSVPLANLLKILNIDTDMNALKDTQEPGHGHLLGSGAEPETYTIALSDVSFVYPVVDAEAGVGMEVLSKVNVEFPGGQKSAVLGLSGVGKSTLFKLVARMYPATRGDLLLGGSPLDQVDMPRVMGIMQQETLLFDMSIKENILIGLPQVDDRLLKRACDLACLTEDPALSVKGLDITVGPKGLKVALHIRQRVGLARILVRNAPVMILDDAVCFQEPVRPKTLPALPALPAWVSMCTLHPCNILLGLCWRHL